MPLIQLTGHHAAIAIVRDLTLEERLDALGDLKAHNEASIAVSGVGTYWRSARGRPHDREPRERTSGVVPPALALDCLHAA
jgi:hypothetical protein